MPTESAAATIETSAPAPPAAAETPLPEGAAAPAAEPPKAPRAKDYAALQRQGFALRQERKRIEAERAQWQERHRATATQLAELQKQVAESQAALAAAKADPISWAAQHGTKADDAIRSFLKEGTPERGIEEAKREAAAARKALDEFRAEQEKKEVARAAEQAKAQENAAIGSFVMSLTEEAKKYPHLNLEYDPPEIAGLVQQIHERAKAQNVRYSFEEVATFLESRAKARFDRKQERRKQLFPDAESGDGDGDRQTPAIPANGLRDSERPATSAQRATTGKTLPKPAPKRALTAKEQEALDLQELRAAMAKDAAARKAGKV